MAKTSKGNQATNSSIINVVVNGLTVNEAINDVKVRLECVEKSAFNIALLCAYSLGVTIPQYTDEKGVLHGEAICDKPIKKQADLLKLIGKSKQTLSRWIKAIKLIIENGYFEEFGSGLLPFSYDKIIIIMESDNFKGHVLKDLMSMTVDSLEAMAEVKKEAEATEEGEPSEEGETEAPEATEAPEEGETEKTTISYNGQDYIVDKALFEKWLAENAIVK